MPLFSTLLSRVWLALLLVTLSAAGGAARAQDGRDAAWALIDRYGFARDQVGFVVAPVGSPLGDLSSRDLSSLGLSSRDLSSHDLSWRDLSWRDLSWNTDGRFVPASTIKIVTSIAADAALGADHRFLSEILADGALRDGVLSGDLILRGSGDPRLEPEHLMALALKVRRYGIVRVDGHLIIDDGALPRVDLVNADQPDDPYNAGIGALGVGFNRVTAYWAPGEAVFTVPPLGEAAILPVGGANGAGTIIDRQVRDGGYRWRIDPRRSTGKQALPVADAGMHAGGLMRQFLRQQGVETGPVVRGPTPDTALLIGAHQSAELRSILRDMLHYSNNQIAEMVGLVAAKGLGVRLDDAARPLDAAASASVAHLRQVLPGVDWSTLLMTNHSGLDPGGRATPRQMAALLAYGYERTDLLTLLPAAAYSGTLARRWVEPGAAFRVWAKTGTVFYGSAIAGYLMPENGVPHLFVIMVTDAAARRDFDADPSRHLELAPDAQAWRERALALQDDLVRLWLD